LPQAQQPSGAGNMPTREAVFAQIRRMLWRGAQPQRG
jgi:hypothetical protein